MEYYSLVEPPGYEVPGMTTRYVIRSLRSDASGVERIRSMTHIIGDEFGSAASLVNDQFIEVAIQAKMGELLTMIGERIEPDKTGYLLRINLVQDPITGNKLASPNLVEAVGVGREPLDALAESYRNGSLAVQPNLKIIRRYFWCTRQNDDLRVDCTSEVLSEELERQAKVEAARQRVVGVSGLTDASQALDRIRQAEFWRDVSSRHLRYVDTEANRALIESLNLQFEASQQRFNESYSEYQIAQRELAENARETALLSRVSAVMGALRAGLSAANQLGPGESSEAALRWREHQSEVLKTASDKAFTELNLNSIHLREVDNRLRNEWARMGVQQEQGELILPVIQHY
jgi:hypothetical protein